MKKLAVAVAMLAIAGVVIAQDAPNAEKPEAAKPAACSEMKAAPAETGASTECAFGAKEKMVDGKPSLWICHKQGCKYFPRKNVKCFKSAEEAKAAGVARFCKICCKDLQ